MVLWDGDLSCSYSVGVDGLFHRYRDISLKTSKNMTH